MKEIISLIIPPHQWRIPVSVALGTFAGLGLYTLYVSNAFSYISDEPSVCMNCHIMAPQYATWQRSSHHTVATCNDCHVPQDNIIKKYAFKGMDGMRHSFIFTFRLEPQVIRIKNMGKKAVLSNCIRCHENFIFKTKMREFLYSSGDVRLCWDCHKETPHGRTTSLSAVPFARVPATGSMVPEWLREVIKNENKNQNKLIKS